VRSEARLEVQAQRYLVVRRDRDRLPGKVSCDARIADRELRPGQDQSDVLAAGVDSSLLRRHPRRVRDLWQDGSAHKG
jgi:hypothetical protein